MPVALWVFHEKRGDMGKQNTLHVKPEAWAAATHVSASENLQCVYCAVALLNFPNHAKYFSSQEETSN